MRRSSRGVSAVAILLLARCTPGVLTTRLERVALCKEVTADALSSPIQIGATFTTRDARAVLWLRLDDLAHPHTIRFRWYDPDGHLYVDSGPVALNADGAYRPTVAVSAGMPIAGAPAEWLPGSWKVVADYDGATLITEKFEIETR